MYYTDPEMGRSCLQLINKLIPQISLSTSLSAQERDDLGSKLFMIVNGLVYVFTYFYFFSGAEVSLFL